MDSAVQENEIMPFYLSVYILSLVTSVLSNSFASPGTVAHQAPLSMGLIVQARILEWVAMPSSRGSSRPKDQTHVSCFGRQILHPLSHLGSPIYLYLPITFSLPMHLLLDA